MGHATLVGEIGAIADRIACEGVAVNQLSFDREMAERLEIAYQARDIVRRRELVHVALAPEVGERVSTSVAAPASTSPRCRPVSASQDR